MFSAGMICTDTLDSLLVHRLISYRSDRLPALMRVWILVGHVLAVVVAVYEIAQVLGWHSPVSDLTVSALLVAALVAVFAYVFVAHAPPALRDTALVVPLSIAVPSTVRSTLHPIDRPTPCEPAGRLRADARFPERTNRMNTADSRLR